VEKVYLQVRGSVYDDGYYKDMNGSSSHLLGLVDEWFKRFERKWLFFVELLCRWTPNQFLT
jgi:hypothetical protein